MVKNLVKIAEKTAKSSNASCWIMGMFHQVKKPAALIKKD